MNTIQTREKNNIGKRVTAAVAATVQAIGCDSSVRSLILTARKADTENGFIIAQAFYEEIKKRGGESRLVTFLPRSWDEPRDDSISQLLRQDYNLVIIPDMDTLGHDPEGKQKPYIFEKQKFTDIIYFRKAKKEIRGFWFMVNSMEHFLNSLEIDYQALGYLSDLLDQELRQTKEIQFFSADSACLTFSIKKGVLPIADYTSKQSRLGDGGNIPFGEVLITPDNKKGNGTIVIDGSIYTDRTISLRESISLTFEAGKVVAVKGESEAEALRLYLQQEEKKTKATMLKNDDISKEYIDNIYRLSEFAIGLNPQAKFCGDLLIDEKVYASAHIALGRSYHGDPAFSHVDLVVRKPKIAFISQQGVKKTVVEDGRVLL